MIKGIGLDLVELSRIKELVERQPKFVDRILTEAEQKRYVRLTPHRQVEYLAGRFAAKEAFAKAVGTGIGSELSFLHIEINNNEQGKPIVVKPFSEGVHLSITHSKEYAAAQVIIEIN